MTRILASMGRRRFNRVDVIAAGLTFMCASHGEWLFMVLSFFGGLMLSALCEGAALSKKGGGALI
jgi:hypothetical protein